jgi:hypothetical protein
MLNRRSFLRTSAALPLATGFRAPLGPQRVAVQLPPGVRGRAVDLLRARASAPFHVADDQTLRCTIPAVPDYEVAAITIA